MFASSEWNEFNHTRKKSLSWDISPHNLIEIDRRFRDAYCIHQEGDDTSVQSDFATP